MPPKKYVYEMPDPAEGWCRQVQIIRNAVIHPPEGMKPRQPCGVRAPLGDVPEAANYRGPNRFQFPPEEAPPTKRIAGRHLWCGPLYAHFGHFLCESINRLWGLKGSGAESLLFMARHPGLLDFDPYHGQMFDLLAPGVPYGLVSEVTEVEELVVPGMGFGMGAVSRMTPEFKARLAEMAEKITPEGGPRLVLSRTRTGRRGNIFLQKFIDENFERYDYDIFHPQHHSIREQLARYKAAEKIVGVDGSAFHLAGFMARPDQHFGVMLRRNHQAYYTIQRQLEGMGTQVTIINALLGDWVPEHRPKANKDSWGQVDQRLLAETLRDAGFIDDLDDWRIPGKEVFDRVLQDMIRRRGGKKLKFIPIEVPIEEQLAGRY